MGEHSTFIAAKGPRSDLGMESRQTPSTKHGASNVLSLRDSHT